MSRTQLKNALRELERIAFARITDVLDDKGRLNLKSPSCCAISKITHRTTDKGEEIRVELFSKLKALELLLKTLQTDTSPDLGEALKQARRRLRS